jgi:hypothetical protein
VSTEACIWRSRASAEPSIGDVDRVAARVELLLGGHLLLDERPDPGEFHLGELQGGLRLREAGLGRGQLGLEGTGVDREKRIAPLHVRPVLEMDRGDQAGHLGHEGDRFARDAAADLLEGAGRVGRLGEGGHHRGGRRLEGRRSGRLLAARRRQQECQGHDPSHVRPPF